MLKTRFTFTLALILTVVSMQAQQIQAYFGSNQFHVANSGAFLETYLTVIGETVVFKKNESGTLQANVEVTLLVKDGETIVDFKKYTLSSPEIAEGGDYPVNFIDQQRFALENGNYDFEIQLLDLNSTAAEKFTAEQVIEVNHPETEVFISDIELIESYLKTEAPTAFTKSGYDIVPLITNYYPENSNELAFYIEVYNSDKALTEDGKFMINYYIEAYESQRTLSQFHRFSKQEIAQVTPLLGKFDVTDLPSGNYNLVTEVRTKTNELVTLKKVFFQRSKPLMKMDAENLSTIQVENTFVAQFSHADTLLGHIYSMRPLCNDIERNVIDYQFKNADVQLMQQFMYSFWYNRNSNAPGDAWKDYRKAVIKVDELYGTRVKEGYETDRGEVYLKYGAPNTITDRPNEPSAYPYQIWHYYKIDRFNNKRFVFYSTALVSTDYELLHSDMQGEHADYQWQMKLHNRNSPGGNIDQTTNGIDHYGGRTEDFYSVPR
jgi:GWxTD domain-containing protein